MPNLNFRLLLLALLSYVLCSGISLRDRVLVHSLHLIEDKALVEPSPKQLFEGALSGMVRQLYPLRDQYSSYIPSIEQKDFENNLDNRFEGIGIIYYPGGENEGYPEIVYPLLNSPAYHAGLRSGDSILTVEGKSVKDLAFHEVTELFKGKSGTKVRLTIRPFGQAESREVDVDRAPIQRDSVEGERIDDNGKRVFRLESDPGIAYIRITSFSDRTALELMEALQHLETENVDGLILDLRYNPGGYVSTSVQIANYFIRPNAQQNVIVSTRYRNGNVKSVHYAHEEGFYFDKPMVVLINGETASAAEILSACLQDYGRATIVGTRSFGKGVVQEIFALPVNSGTISLSDASYWRPSQKNINRSHDSTEEDQWGVLPDEDGSIPVSEKQALAQLQIRDRRSNTVCSDSKRFLTEYLKILPDLIEQEAVEQRRLAEDDEDHEADDDDEITPTMEPTSTVKEVPVIGELEKKQEKNDLQPTGSPFVLQGSAPYFDPQLDKAIELMKLRTSNLAKTENEDKTE